MSPAPSIRHTAALLLSMGFALVFSASTLRAAALKPAATSKLFVADMQGEAKIETGDKIVEMAKKSSYSPEGTIIETARAQGDRPEGQHSSMVYSNGTGIYFAPGTRLEVKKFSQEPFAPNRTDLDVEPSISQTQAFLSRGTVGLCTSKQVAGSSMVYQTPHGSVSVRGRRVMVEVTDEYTKISSLEGESTVRANTGNPADVNGQTLHAGEQALIRSGTPGHPATIEISKIPDDEKLGLESKAAIACLARRTVFFDSVDGNAGPEIVAEDTMSANLPKQFTVSPARL
jgi:hypothetical protein